MRKLLYAAVAVCFLFFGTIGGAKVLDLLAPYLGHPTLDIVHYQIKMQMTEWPPKALDFETQIQLKSILQTNEIELHVESSVLNVLEVRFENQVVPFSILPGISNQYGLSGSVLAVQLPRDIQAQEEVTLTLHYSVSKVDWADDKGLFYVPGADNFGQDLLITRNWPYYARYWVPSNDTPDDVATVAYDFYVPKQLMVAANGRLLAGNERTGSGIARNGLRRFQWQQNVPTTTYNFVFAVGQFDVQKKRICYDTGGMVNNRTVACAGAEYEVPAVMYYNKNNPAAAEFLTQTRKALSSLVYFSKLFAPYEFEKIGFILSPYPFAMESTSLIVIDSPSSAVHEVIHHWWGNNVHIEHWGDFWISEGFTSFFTGLYDEYVSGTNTTCLDKPDADLNHSPLTDPNDIFDDTPYCKGAFAIQNLQVRIANLAKAHPKSKQVFLDLMRDVFLNFKGQRLSSFEFADFIEQHLLAIYANQGVTVTDAGVKKLVLNWKKSWLVEIPAPLPVKAKGSPAFQHHRDLVFRSR